MDDRSEVPERRGGCVPAAWKLGDTMAPVCKNKIMKTNKRVEKERFVGSWSGVMSHYLRAGGFVQFGKKREESEMVMRTGPPLLRAVALSALLLSIDGITLTQRRHLLLRRRNWSTGSVSVRPPPADATDVRRGQSPGRSRPRASWRPACVFCHHELMHVCFTD